MSDYTDIVLTIREDVAATMESRGILEAEIKQVIGSAEESGVKLRNEDGTIFIAKARIADVTYYAEYAPAGDGFEVLKAYCCKTEVTGV